MSKSHQVPVKFEPFLVAGNDRYAIHSHLEILFILRAIMQKNTLVTLHLDQGNGFIRTSILGIDAERGRMVVDCGADERFNRQALTAEKLIFITPQAQVNVQFVCHGIQETRFEGRRAFSVNIPESLLRMQRRDTYRIATPAINPLKCTGLLAAGHNPGTVEATLLDISCGGMAVVEDHRKIAFEPTTTHENCRIALPGIGVINVTIEVKSTFDITLKNGLACKRAGCEFVAMPEKMRVMTQRYIFKLERERTARRKATG